MLIAALAVTLVGFVLLVVALVISSVPFAWACIGVCVLGLVLLVVDIIRGRRSAVGRAGEGAADFGEDGYAQEAAPAGDRADDADR